MKLLGRARALDASFCDRCSRVCDDGCRRATSREHAVGLRLRHGVWF